MHTKITAAITSLLLAAACVTINVYFPAAAAEKAADRIIEDVWQQPDPATPAPAPESALPARIAVAVLDFLVPPARAQQPDIDVTSPAVQRIKASLQSRFAELKPLLDSGVVGLTGDGLVTVRDAGAVPLAQRNAVKSTVAAENGDRGALYREIAVANDHPQWEDQIRAVFAQRWVAKAAPGWWYQDASGWKQRQ